MRFLELQCRTRYKNALQIITATAGSLAAQDILSFCCSLGKNTQVRLIGFVIYVHFCIIIAHINNIIIDYIYCNYLYFIISNVLNKYLASLISVIDMHQ